MSEPNPPRRRRHVRRRWYDERIWRDFYAACLSQTSDITLAANRADAAYAEYRERFPVREPELEDESAALETESNGEASTSQTKKDPVQ